MEQAACWLREARSVTVLTGAGISAESGVPTFRAPTGRAPTGRAPTGREGVPPLWNNFRAEDLATPEAFHRDPKLVWQWYDWRRGLIAACKPNLGHFALSALEDQKEARKLDFTLITQNVDGLHNRAGSRRILKIHGDIWWVQCLACHKVTSDFRVPIPALPPHCPCGGMLRPAIVWFGESLPLETWNQAETAAQSCDLFLVAGTSAVVYPAAGLAPLAQRHGARVIEINMEETPLSGAADISLRGHSGEILPALIAS
ncbi:MAG: NAD-dependent deacylase [Candidatus Solibacter usitatus]|nr:NAD-dependent deacylase [Candidatus Solibacter usitatus]